MADDPSRYDGSRPEPPYPTPHADADPYWPDLTLLPEGWRIAHIAWESGRALVMLERDRDDAEAYSTDDHRTPAGAFADAISKAEAHGP